MTPLHQCVSLPRTKRAALTIHVTKISSWMHVCGGWVIVLWQNITIIPQIHSNVSPPLATPTTHKHTQILPQQYQKSNQDSSVLCTDRSNCAIVAQGGEVQKIYFIVVSCKSFVVIYYNWNNINNSRVYRRSSKYHVCIILTSKDYIIDMFERFELCERVCLPTNWIAGVTWIVFCVVDLLD